MENTIKEEGKKGFFGDKRFLGSNFALIFGIFAVLGGVSDSTSGIFTAGIAMVFGSLAYKSAKKRKLGTVGSSSTRRILEVVALILVFLAVALQNDLRTRIVNDPFSNIIIPAWAITAYLTVACNRYSSLSGNKMKQVGAVVATFIAANIALYFAFYLIS